MSSGGSLLILVSALLLLILASRIRRGRRGQGSGPRFLRAAADLLIGYSSIFRLKSFRSRSSGGLGGRLVLHARLGNAIRRFERWCRVHHHGTVAGLAGRQVRTPGPGPHHRLSGPTDPVMAVAVGRLLDRDVIISGSNDNTALGFNAHGISLATGNAVALLQSTETH